jgi:hypothetical protein
VLMLDDVAAIATMLQAEALPLDRIGQIEAARDLA